MMAVTRLTGSEAVRAVLADQLEPLCSLAEEVEGRLVDWEWEVAGLVRERLRLAMLGRTEQTREQAWAEHRLDLYYTVREAGEATFNYPLVLIRASFELQKLGGVGSKKALSLDLLKFFPSFGELY